MYKRLIDAENKIYQEEEALSNEDLRVAIKIKNLQERANRLLDAKKAMKDKEKNITEIETAVQAIEDFFK